MRNLPDMLDDDELDELADPSSRPETAVVVVERTGHDALQLQWWGQCCVSYRHGVSTSSQADARTPMAKCLERHSKHVCSGTWQEYSFTNLCYTPVFFHLSIRGCPRAHQAIDVD